jgi:hypothetical protein
MVNLRDHQRRVGIAQYTQNLQTPQRHPQFRFFQKPDTEAFAIVGFRH